MCVDLLIAPIKLRVRVGIGDRELELIDTVRVCVVRGDETLH